MKIIFTFVLMAISSLGFCGSQRDSLLYKAADYKEFLKIPDGYLSLNRKKSKKVYYLHSLSIAKYDKDMRLVKEVVVAGSEKGFSYYYAAIKESNNKFFLIYIENVNPSKEVSPSRIISREIDIETLQTGSNKIIADENSMDAFLDGKYGSEHKILLQSSLDKKHHALFVYYGEEQFYVAGLNENFDRVWQRKQSIPDYKLRAFFFRSVHSDNQGNIFILVASFLDGVKIFRYSSTGEVTFKNLVGADNVINDGSFYTETSTGKILMFGTCRNNSDYVTGVFKAELNTTLLTLEKVQITPIPESIVKTLYEHDCAGLKPRKYGVFPTYFNSKIFGEQTQDKQLVIECFINSIYNSLFWAADMVTVNFNGEKPVFAIVPRTSNFGDVIPVLHCSPFVCKDKLVLVYTDAVENLHKKPNEELTVSHWDDKDKKVMIVAAFIGSDGSVEKKEIVIDNELGLWQSVKKYLTNECGL